VNARVNAGLNETLDARSNVPFSTRPSPVPSAAAKLPSPACGTSVPAKGRGVGGEGGRIGGEGAAENKGIGKERRTTPYANASTRPRQAPPLSKAPPTEPAPRNPRLASDAVPSARPNVEHLLRDYSDWRNEPPLDMQPMGHSVMARIVEEQHNAGARGDGLRYQIITDEDGTATPCRPDGGLAAQSERYARAITRDHRCRDFAKLVMSMPADHYAVVEAGWHVPPTEDPRSERDAAEKLGISRADYRVRKARMMGWVEGRWAVQKVG
jgi:hypothetical protein